MQRQSSIGGSVERRFCRGRYVSVVEGRFVARMFSGKMRLFPMDVSSIQACLRGRAATYPYADRPSLPDVFSQLMQAWAQAEPLPPQELL